MIRLSDALAGAVLSFVFLAPLTATAAPTDEAAIRVLEARFAKAVAAKDLDGLMAVYSPRVFVFDVIPPRQYVGKEAYRADWKGVLAGIAGPAKYQITDLVVATDGTIAYSHSIQHLSGVDPKGAPVDLTVRVTDVFRKQAGAWSIVQEHISVPVDLETDKGDLASKP